MSTNSDETGIPLHLGPSSDSDLGSLRICWICGRVVAVPFVCTEIGPAHNTCVISLADSKSALVSEIAALRSALAAMTAERDAAVKRAEELRLLARELWMNWLFHDEDCVQEPCNCGYREMVARCAALKAPR